jgi:regulator of protease activity HflC (stomatin/prohibitin superfamily)
MRPVTKIFGVLGTFFIVLVVLFLLLSSVRVIQAGEVGVKTEWGKVVDVLHPDLYFVVPVMHDIKYMSTQIEKFETPASAASNDLQIVQTQIAVNYRISGDDEEIKSLWETFRGRHEQRLIQPIVQEAVKANTAKFNAEELITKRVDVKQKISNDLTDKLSDYGLDVVEVSITDMDFSDEFDAAIEAKVVANQKLQKEQIDLQTKKIEVQKTIAERNASATALVIQAEAEAKSKVIKADAEAEAIQTITESLNDPYVRYLYVLQWDGALPKVMGENDLIVDLEGLGNSSG